MLYEKVVAWECPRNLSSANLYSKGSKLELPFTSIQAEYKVSKVRHVMMLGKEGQSKRFVF